MNLTKRMLFFSSFPVLALAVSHWEAGLAHRSSRPIAPAIHPLRNLQPSQHSRTYPVRAPGDAAQHETLAALPPYPRKKPSRTLAPSPPSPRTEPPPPTPSFDLLSLSPHRPRPPTPPPIPTRRGCFRPRAKPSRPTPSRSARRRSTPPVSRADLTAGSLSPPPPRSTSVP